MESAEFSSQLAQFSSLEELQNLGTKLDNGLEADMLLAQSINNTMASTLIGKEVIAAANVVEFDGENKIDLGYDLTGAASEVTIEIFDSNGKLIKTITETSMEAGDHTFEWDGKNEQNATVPEGDYSIEINAKIGGEDMAVQPLIRGLVESVKFVNGNPMLMVNGKEISYGAVLEIINATDTTPSDDEENLIRRLIRTVG